MSLASVEAPERTAAGADEQQVVVLRVKDGDYAVPIGRVPSITRVPNAGTGVEGVINLRGRVLPVLDLATRLG